MSGVDQLQLPDDPALLKQLLVRRTEELTQRDVMLAQHQAMLAQRDALLEQRQAMLEQVKREAAAQLEAQRQKHEAEVQALLRRFYGPRSERFDPTQLLLFGITIDTLPLDRAAIEEQAGQKLATRRPRHKHGRQKLPSCLERVKIEHDLKDQQKNCPCCGQERQCIGSEITEQLEHYPASFKVLQHVQHKYACPHCEGQGQPPQIELAEKPIQPIEKGLAGPGLLAYVITSKLADHLPLYRLERIFARHDLHIASSTMCAWMAAAAELIRPLQRLMIERVKGSKVIHTDETRVPVQAKGQCRSGRIWTYIGDESNPYVIYDYTPDRTRAGPARWLANYKGYLQADAYGGYDGIYSNGLVIEVACWAHARRKFFDARESDGARSARMLAMVAQLYAVEEQATRRIAAIQDCSMEQAYSIRCQLRQEQSTAILERIKAWLDEQRELVLPRSPMAAAITYTLNQWQALCRYCRQGWLSIDNNAAERALKRVAIGRKNWLFAGNDAFGQHHAVLWSLIASAEAQGIDPQRYLTSVLAKIATTPMSELDQFLPDRWRAGAVAEAMAPAPP